MTIDGMAKILYNNNRVKCEIVDAVEISTALYNEGYRHQSDTAKEILEELEAELAEAKCFDNEYAVYLRLTIEQLKTKYIKECEG